MWRTDTTISIDVNAEEAMADEASGAERAGLGKTSIGMQPNFAALLSYLLGLVTGLIFFLIEKENKFVKFHAMQSICFALAVSVLSIALMFIPVIGWVAIPILQLTAFVAWIVLMVKAYQGQWFRLPLVGDFAAKQVGGI